MEEYRVTTKKTGKCSPTKTDMKKRDDVIEVSEDDLEKLSLGNAPLDDAAVAAPWDKQADTAAAVAAPWDRQADTAAAVAAPWDRQADTAAAVAAPWDRQATPIMTQVQNSSNRRSGQPLGDHNLGNERYIFDRTDLGLFRADKVTGEAFILQKNGNVPVWVAIKIGQDY